MNPLRDAFLSAGIDPKTCRRLHSDTACPSTFLFAFYVMMGGGNPFFVVLLNSSPIWEHKSSKSVPAEAALEVLLAKGVVDPKTSDPTVIIPVSGLFGSEIIFFVQVDEKSLVKKDLFSFFKPDVYSLVNPKTGKTDAGKDKTIPGFCELFHYNSMLTALSPMLSSAPLPSLSGFARGGGGGGAVARGGGGGAVASPHHGGRKKTHSAPKCGHARCADLHTRRAGHGAIVLPFFEYKFPDGSNKPVIIMGFETRRSGNFWNFFCEKMDKSDHGCWIATIARALREEAKIFLSRNLEDSDIRLDNPIGKTPVFYVQLDRTMVTHKLSRGVLNAQVAADNSDSRLPDCYKEIQAIGFFERIGNNLVPLDGNPAGYPNTFSDVVNTWRLSKGP